MSTRKLVVIDLSFLVEVPSFSSKKIKTYAFASPFLFLVLLANGLNQVLVNKEINKSTKIFPIYYRRCWR